MTFDDPLGVADHLAGKRQVRRQNQNPEIRVAEQQPGAEKPDQGGFARIAEGQQDQFPLAPVPTFRKPGGYFAVEFGRRQSLDFVPPIDKIAE